MYFTAVITIVLGVLFCSVFAVYNPSFNNGAFSSFAQGPQYQGAFSSPTYGGPQSMTYNGVPSVSYNGGQAVSYSGVQNVDYTLQGQYQAQVQGGHYVTAHSYPDYNQPGLPFHTRQETPVTHHVVHHVQQSPMVSQPQYGPMPMYNGPMVHPQPMGHVGVGVPVVAGHYPPPVYQPDLLTHVVNHPVGRIVTTAGLAALFYKAID